MAQDDTETTFTTPVKAMYKVLPLKPAAPGVAAPSTPLTTWNGSFTYQGTKYTYNMVGKAPAANVTTTVQAILIPLKIVIGTHTFDAAHVLSNGNSVTTNTVKSPIFDKTTTYTQGGVNVGTTQYIDAYQRANFWKLVSTHTSSHTLLGGPKILPEVTLKVPSGQGSTGSPFGYLSGLVDINWFDGQLNAIIANNPTVILPNTFPIFLAYDTYLTEGGCCIGGYHSATGAQTYSYATYVDHPTFAQDVSALSHEVGEWMDDPLLNGGNSTPCGILENGDPLENNANFGAYHYVLHGFTYNLQDLVTLPYFGAPKTTSVNNFFTFQGEHLSVCQNGA
jgi:hypothetical protein